MGVRFRLWRRQVLLVRSLKSDGAGLWKFIAKYNLGGSCRALEGITAEAWGTRIVWESGRRWVA